METLACAIIAAGAAVASAIITAAASSRRVDKNLALHDEKSAGRKQALSADHENLSRDLEHIFQDVVFLRDGRIADEARREVLKGQALDSQKALDVLHASLTHMAELERQLAEAREEIATLQAALQQTQERDQGGEELEP